MEVGNLAEGEMKACVVEWGQTRLCILGHQLLTDDQVVLNAKDTQPWRKKNRVPPWRCGKFGVIMVHGKG